MVAIFREEEILGLLKNVDLVEPMKKAFIDYSNGNSVVPPVGELLFVNPKGEAHIKYGYIKNEEYYVVKIASGFYENPKLGVSSSQGVVLLFSQKTGELKAVLLDNGRLTDIRTAAAGALVAKYFAPKRVKAIGVIGTGIQARLQLEHLLGVIDCSKVCIWGRSQEKMEELKNQLSDQLEIEITQTTSELASKCNLIVTTTPSNTPLLKSEDVLSGTHITAVGSDASVKQELDSDILEKADLVVVDSIPQSKQRGEVFRAMKDGVIKQNSIIELGVALQKQSLQRNNEDQITIVDLTGVAVQDIAIAKAVYENFNSK